MYSLNGKEILARLQFSYNLRKIWCNSKYYNLYQNMTGDYYEQYQTPVPLNLRLCSNIERETSNKMRKNIERMIGLTLCMGMLAGCAQTPESSLVRQKGNKALDSYKEADDKDVNMAGNASSADQTTASENTGTSDTAASTDVHPDNASAARTTIRDLINAPETYKSQVTDDTSKLVVNTDAAVEIPDVERYLQFLLHQLQSHRIFLMVSQMPFSQMRRFTLQTAITYRQRMRSRKNRRIKRRCCQRKSGS